MYPCKALGAELDIKTMIYPEEERDRLKNNYLT